MIIGNRPELYNKSVDVLYQAYFNDELKHGFCTACAVGNICKESARELGVSNGSWELFFVTVLGIQRWNIGAYIGIEQKELIKIREMIINTGYSMVELSKIEAVFEKAKGLNRADRLFNGLVAVLEILKHIHEVEDDKENHIKFKSHFLTLTA